MNQHKSSKNILLIEDDILLSEMYSIVLEDNGYAVQLVKDGKTAVNTPLEDKDLILLDIRIPEVDGMEVLKKYRENGFSKPIIIITNSPQVNKSTARMYGATDFLIKSHTDIDRVVDLVENYLH